MFHAGGLSSGVPFSQHVKAPSILRGVAYREGMKHITFADKTLLVGDEVADLLVAYCTALANAQKADSVEVHGYSATGEEVAASFVFTTGSSLMAETVHTSMPAPDNTEAIEHMQVGLLKLRDQAVIIPDDSTPPNAYVEFDL